MHLLQIVEVEVLQRVERTVVTCWVGVPAAGEMVLVMGHLVTVLATLVTWVSGED